MTNTRNFSQVLCKHHGDDLNFYFAFTRKHAKRVKGKRGLVCIFKALIRNTKQDIKPVSKHLNPSRLK
jgi:hypothetical protein